MNSEIEIEIDVKSNSHLLLFFSTGCSYCKDVINELSSTELIYRNISVLIKIDDFSIFNEYKQILEEHHIICEPLVEQVFNDYSIKGFPFAIYIKNGKVISKGPAPSLKAINEVKRITGKVA
ncbi:hypothetical protein [Bacillus thuringiensis]|uniref:TlpA family protein disulfide reductase n=1 Tax=Bacillus thuringiensis TaxID=1428 RepID=UPI002D804C95|nr:hypothetical protein [Bacillus thuringiensis]MEB4818072.1 hypothetical protein [Bacillus thuringiensis]